MRAMIVFNPTAGQAGALEAELNAAADVWRGRGWQVDVRPTSGPGNGTALARAAAAQHYSMVVAAGGDGTINEVINGLAGTQTALATLPLGTMNVWARELGLPLQPRAAAAALLEWQIRPIDLGRAGDRYFLLMAGIGIDAAITSSVKTEEKRRLGVLAYVLRTINLVPRIRGTRTRLVIDGKTIKGRVLWVVVGNSQLYGGLIKITHRASIDDGLLDICVIRGDGFGSALLHLVSLLRQRYNNDPEIEYYRARTVQVISSQTLPVQVDGDTIGATPMTFQAAPRALLALLPTTLPDDLMQPMTAQPSLRGRSLQRLAGWFGRRGA
ncbi:MAG: diacylglycerol kinase family lipid kinase [Chloroflexaceae bacterium]|jgi:YegS/Rv2252/BmrU family lipid kinase|nr:diacylglycerol kinase family lipid kinase [Chloroflexaceae bacterium]